MLLSPIFRAFQLIKGHTKCFSDILITIDHSTCSLYLFQSALNQSALNQIQGRLKKVTFLFKADLKIFVLYFVTLIKLPETSHFLKILAALRAARAPPRDPVPGQLPSWVDPWVMGTLYHPPNQFSYAPAKKVTFTNQDL